MVPNRATNHKLAHYRVRGILNCIKVQFFFGKNVQKKYLCCHTKNYYHFLKSNIPVINLIVGSMIKLSKNMTLEKLGKQREWFLPNAGNFLAFFIIFEWGRIFVIAIDK